MDHICIQLDHGCRCIGPRQYTLWTILSMLDQTDLQGVMLLYILANVNIPVESCLYTCCTIPVYMLDHVRIHLDHSYTHWTRSTCVSDHGCIQLDHGCIHTGSWLCICWKQAVFMFSVYIWTIPAYMLDHWFMHVWPSLYMFWTMPAFLDYGFVHVDHICISLDHGCICIGP